MPGSVCPWADTRGNRTFKHLVVKIDVEVSK